MDEARHILDAYLARTGLRHPADVAQQYQIALAQQWTVHLDVVLEHQMPDWPELRSTIIREFVYGIVPDNAEAELRVAMHQDMTYWAERAAPDPAVIADLGPAAASAGFLPDWRNRYSVVRCRVCGVVLRSHEPADHTWTPDPAEIAAENARLALADPGLPPDGHQGAAFDV
jgi:hypothetical protein